MDNIEENFYNELDLDTLDVLADTERICKFYDNENHPMEVEWSKACFRLGDVTINPFVDDGFVLYHVEDGVGERIVADLCNYLDSVFGD